jgi:hypothetical protein
MLGSNFFLTVYKKLQKLTSSERKGELLDTSNEHGVAGVG